MADVTKDLLIRISTEGNDDAAGAIQKQGSAVDDFLGKMTGLNQAWEFFNKILGVVQTTAGYAYDAIATLTNTAARFEDLGVRFETIYGGAGPAQKALDWAEEFATKTPMTLQEVTDAMLRMKSYGFDPMNGSLEAIGNAAYALGADFDGIVMALGQMRLKGKVSAEELMQLSERGVPAIRWLKEELGLTEKQMASIGNAGIDVDKAIEVIIRRMNTDYKGAMERAADTFNGAISTITGYWEIFQKKLMDNGPFEFITTKVREIRDAFAELLESNEGFNFMFRAGGILTQHFERWESVLKEQVFPAVGMVWDGFLNLLSSAGALWNYTLDFMKLLAPIGVALQRIVGLGAEGAEASELFSTAWVNFIQSIVPTVLTGLLKVSYLIATTWTQGKYLVFEWAESAKIAVLDFLAFLNKGFRESPMAYMIGDDKFAAFAAKIVGWKDQINRHAIDLDAAKNKELAALDNQRDFWKTFISGVSGDLKSWDGILDAMKMNVADPLGLKSLMSNIPTEGRLLWESGTNEKTRGKVLYDVEQGIGTDRYMNDDGGRLDYSKMNQTLQPQQPQQNAVQLLPPPGDDLMTLIVKYLNQCIKSEGTIGAGF